MACCPVRVLQEERDLGRRTRTRRCRSDRHLEQGLTFLVHVRPFQPPACVHRLLTPQTLPGWFLPSIYIDEGTKRW